MDALADKRTSPQAAKRLQLMEGKQYRKECSPTADVPVHTPYPWNRNSHTLPSSPILAIHSMPRSCLGVYSTSTHLYIAVSLCGQASPCCRVHIGTPGWPSHPLSVTPRLNPCQGSQTCIVQASLAAQSELNIPHKLKFLHPRKQALSVITRRNLSLYLVSI